MFVYGLYIPCQWWMINLLNLASWYLPVLLVGQLLVEADTITSRPPKVVRLLKEWRCIRLNNFTYVWVQTLHKIREKIVATHSIFSSWSWRVLHQCYTRPTSIWSYHYYIVTWWFWSPCCHINRCYEIALICATMKGTISWANLNSRKCSSILRSKNQDVHSLVALSHLFRLMCPL